MTRTARLAIHHGMHRLQVAGYEHARHEAEWLLSRLMGLHPLELYVEERTIPEPTLERYLAEIDARASGIPLQYLVGETEFFGAPFAVASGVFIPRPETETVLEAAVGALRELQERLGHPLRLLDLGTGTGCIAVTLARCLPACVVVGVEVSWEALQIASANVRRHGLSERIQLVQGWWAGAIRTRVDGIISNPPYVPSVQVDHLPLDVRYEPRLSLDGGPDGMRDLSHIMREAERLLTPGGLLALECAESQVARLTEMARAAGWAQRIRALHDLAQRPRGVLVVRSR